MVSLQYNSAIAGYQFTSDAYYIGSADLSRFVAADTSVATDNRVHILSGFYFVGNNNTWYQDTLGYWVTGGYQTTKAASLGNGQDHVNQIIRNNKKIYENNLLCSAAAKYMTADDLQLLQDLQNRMLIRNQALENNTLTTSRKVSFPEGYINLSSKLDILMNQKVGVVLSTGALIVVSAVVITSVAIAAYFAYKAFAAESEDDVKFSDELTAKLVSKLSASELAQLYDETEGIVTSARLKEKFGTIAGFGSTLLWFIAGAGLLYWWQNRKTTTKKKSKKE